MFIKIITEIIVKEQGINIIATTHSPSTVALAEEEALYVMYPDRPGLHKTRKGQALNILTTDVPTLSLSYEGRRQVFVESPNDAILYNLLFQIMRLNLNTELSLEFIATGTTNKGSHQNTGCSNVYNLVKMLIASGNTSIFGLVDWDTKNPPDKRIEVIGYERRYAIENIILDPLLVAAIIVRVDQGNASKIGLQQNVSYSEFIQYTSDKLQSIVDHVQKIILGVEELSEDYITADYLGNFSLALNNHYLKMKGHELSGKILQVFPGLNAVAKGKPDKLMQYIVENILRDQPKFIPLEISIAFNKLLNEPNHLEQKNIGSLITENAMGV